MPIALPPPVHVLVALLPVLCFLALLRLFDSYKLTRLSMVLATLAAGVVAALASYPASLLALGPLGLAPATYSQHVAPLVEEVLKGLLIVWLVRSNRIGFLVDAAIFGFAVGSGFALVENLAYLHMVPDASRATWVVRGFGTAVMHGGTTAVLAVVALTLIDRLAGAARALSFLPGLAMATALHWGFNFLTDWPQWAMLATLVVVPAVLIVVFRHSETVLAVWLGDSFDADAHMLDMLNSGSFADSPAGRYLQTLKQVFDGPIMADVLCYVRVFTELSLRAKGLLMLRETGFPVAPIDDETRSRLEELQYLERSIGATGLRALQPLLRIDRKELTQLHLLASR